MVEIGSFFGLLLLIANIYAIVKIIGSGVSTGKKVIWIVIILVLPVAGLIAWIIFGPKV